MSKYAYKIKIATTGEAIDLAEQLKAGELVYDTETRLCYYMGNTHKFSVLIDEELSPCLGSNCPKREHCYKYFLAQKLPEDSFILRDLSTEVETLYDRLEHDLGKHIRCGKENRYKHFRWDDK